MQEQKVSTEMATDEVNKWLDAKKISVTKRQSKDFEPFVNQLIEAVSEGILVLQEDNSWKHILSVPVEDEHGNVRKSEITYKFRINEIDKKKHRRSVTKDDNALLLTLLTLTNEPRGIIESLDSSTDKSLADSIALFFL